ncbi:MAG: carbohydrate-binding family 9-like protein [Bacteroidetes bacterium]|nr:MAG: carbohydrate-binding family 9-like protein [Bacteroidota bacterium]
MNFRAIILIMGLLSYGLTGSGQHKLLEEPPLNYVCYRATAPITLDGKLDEPDWQQVPWTEDFVDIEGSLKPLPHYRTRVKMLWDDEYFYIAAQLEEPHIWATFTERESIIFLENNFEVFIDPSGDTHNYFELEINALGTIWDLMLTKPYRNGGLPISAWDVAGFRYGIHKQGTINDPSDTDTMWVVEMAFPWKILAETAPGKRKPDPGDQWRVNFSRVQWQLDIVDGTYQKTINPETGKPFPEYNWVWSPQWAINMHTPEHWGYVQFSGIEAGGETEPFAINPDEKIKYLLRELYYQQYAFRQKTGYFAQSMEELNPDNQELYETLQVRFEATPNRFILRAPSTDQSQQWFITEDSRIWKQ